MDLNVGTSQHSRFDSHFYIYIFFHVFSSLLPLPIKTYKRKKKRKKRGGRFESIPSPLITFWTLQKMALRRMISFFFVPGIFFFFPPFKNNFAPSILKDNSKELEPGLSMRSISGHVCLKGRRKSCIVSIIN